MEKIVKDDTDAVMKMHYDVANDDFSRAGQASSQIKKSIKQLGLDPKVIRRVSIATYEAEINLVIHSMGGFIDVFLKPEHIEIFVEDRGPGIENIDKAMTKGFSTASSTAREMGFGAGMGLPNMEKVSDTFEIQSEVGVGTTIKMVLFYDSNV